MIPPPPDAAGSRALPPLHLITDDTVLGAAAFLTTARSVLRAGGSEVALHLRGPGSTGRHLFDLAHELRSEATRAAAALIVNDRIDVALAVEADGVQLGGRSLRVDDLPPSLRLPLGAGASVHGAEEARCAGGAAWLLVGTLWATPTHPGHPGGGVDRIREVRRARPGLPLVGIGGITPERVEEVLRAGAHGVAVLGGVWHAPDPAVAVLRYLEEMEAFRGEELRDAPRPEP